MVTFNLNSNGEHLFVSRKTYEAINSLVNRVSASESIDFHYMGIKVTFVEIKSINAFAKAVDYLFDVTDSIKKDSRGEKRITKIQNIIIDASSVKPNSSACQKFVNSDSLREKVFEPQYGPILLAILGESAFEKNKNDSKLSELKARNNGLKKDLEFSKIEYKKKLVVQEMLHSAEIELSAFSNKITFFTFCTILMLATAACLYPQGRTVYFVILILHIVLALVLIRKKYLTVTKSVEQFILRQNQNLKNDTHLFTDTAYIEEKHLYEQT